MLIIPALMTATLFAQGPGGFGRRGGNANSNTPPTPPTPAELASRQLQMVATFLRLDSAQTAALTGNSGLVSALEAEENTLQANAATLKTDYGTFATQLIATPTAAQPTAELSTIGGYVAVDLAARATAAGAIVAALQSLSPALSTQQTASLPSLIEMLVRGGAGGFGGPRR